MGEVARVQQRPFGRAPEAVFVTLRIRPSRHFLRRLAERGGDPERLVVEGGTFEVAGWLRPIREHDFGLIVPGFGHIRIRVARSRGGFVAVTYLPVGAA